MPRRKIVRLRRMMRRKADPKTGKHTLCEPAQSKYTWTFHKSHFVWKFTGKTPDPNPPTHVLCEPAQSKRTWTFHKSHFVWNFTGKTPDPNPPTHVSCEPVQSKRTWTFHKSHFVWKFTRKNTGPQSPDTRFVRACAVETHMDISQEPFCMENHKKKHRTPIPRHTFCASLRSRNAHGHCTRAILCGNLQEKCWTCMRPRLDTGPKHLP